MGRVDGVRDKVSKIIFTTMPKKTKSKARLDKYYHLAKEHGYRSRAAFKLIQLNQKFDFLSKAVCLVDLCAAPGGWLQVASKYMPMNSIKLGVDLVPIKNVNGCVTFQADITTPKCLAMIKREIKHVKADVVLHDGAPNVGADWNKDAYQQLELVLASLKLATQLLRSGGTFVTKVFRSREYMNLLAVFKQLFRKVSVTKPKASRTSSAEIFVVCTGYLAPAVVEPQLLDPKVVFNDSLTDKKNVVSSLKQLLNKKKRERSGYAEDSKGIVYGAIKLSDLINSVNPYQALKEVAKITIDEDAKQHFDKVRPPKDLENICKDTKVLGKGDLSTLLKWRTQVLHHLAKKKRDEEEKAAAEAGVQKHEKQELNEEEELEKFVAEKAKQERKSKKKTEKRSQKQISKYNRSEFGGEINMDEDMGFDELLSEGEDIENIGHISLSDTDNEIERHEFDIKEDESDDDRIERMNEEMEEQYKKQVEESTLKRNVKQKKSLNKSLKKFEEDESLEEMEDDSEEDKKESAAESDKFVNPLKERIGEIIANDEGPPAEKLPRKRKKPEKDREDDEPMGVVKEKSERDLRKEKKKKQREKLQRQGKLHNGGFEEVPQEFDDMDSDAIAETVAIAKLMLRKKNREELIDASYNRYVFEEDKNSLPAWFADDEEKHNKPQLPVSREMIQAEKERLREFNVKTPKKALEARARKKNKIARKLEKLKQRAQVIARQDDISEASKFRQIEKMYKKEKATKKPDKKYVVIGKTNTGKRIKKRGKNVKFVDRRMKKDIRAQKRIMRKGRRKR